MNYKYESDWRKKNKKKGKNPQDSNANIDTETPKWKKSLTKRQNF